MKNVLKHKAVNKAIAFCDGDNLNLIYTGMFSEVNNGKGITDDLELYLVSYLLQKHNVKGFCRASAYVLEDQTTFIGFDIKTVDNEVWSQQNLFSVDEESKVIGVEADLKDSSDKNLICPLVKSYFEKISELVVNGTKDALTVKSTSQVLVKCLVLVIRQMNKGKKMLFQGELI